MCKLLSKTMTDREHKMKGKPGGSSSPASGSNRKLKFNQDSKTRTFSSRTAFKRSRPTSSPEFTLDNLVSESIEEAALKKSVFENGRFDVCSSPPAKMSAVTNSIAYAGAKFHVPPAPKHLPMPPIHWVSQHTMCHGELSCDEMTDLLKSILKVPPAALHPIKVAS